MKKYVSYLSVYVPFFMGSEILPPDFVETYRNTLKEIIGNIAYE
ncbi:hypothetical protein [Microbulbifer sp. 2205BS26-8]|nr:hypothetical protein [Microbulbifer sp. 2205BS26-8]MDP5209775.1 hypothetical protein [Microbulbifer sp. 2205BS26-8]